MLSKKSTIAAALGLAILAAAAYGDAVPSYKADAAANQAAEQEQAAPALAGTDFAISVNGTVLALEAPASLAGSTMLVPLRNIAEALGAAVSYDEGAETVTAVKDGISVSFRIGSREAVRNGAPIVLDAPAVKNGSVTMVPLRFFSEAFGTAVKWDGANRRVSIDHESYLLPAVGSYDNLKKLLKENETQGGVLYGAETGIAVMATRSTAQDTAASEPARGESAKSAIAGSAGDYSGTNVQVGGVDEADVVKTDGEYIYQVNRDRIVIARAYPAEAMSIAAELPLAEYSMIPHDIYVDGDRLTVIGRTYDKEVYYGDKLDASPNAARSAKKIRIIPYGSETVKAVLFDIGSKTAPKAVKEVELEGSYVSSRKIGNDLYLITNKHADRYRIMNDKAEMPAPSYRDSAVSTGMIPADYDSIRYFPDTFLDSYMMVAGIRTDKPEDKASVSVYLGSAQNVYASEKHLYVSASIYKPVPQVSGEGASSSGAPFKESLFVNQEPTTVAYKFRLDQAQVRFAAKGEVPGTILNQFSMDEYDGYFRIATTKGDMWRTDQFTSKNNVYILDESMNRTGSIEDIAPSERIYSVRFMGGRGYMVTFKKVDPLFVLDLSNPYSPAILGKLKIPGYSDYLHPYDETHLIGFGKDAVEVADEWGAGGGSAPSTTAFYQGIKIAMFDVSDVSQPKELFKTGIGDRGTDSELLRNHKALLFSKEKNLMAFPVTVMETTPQQKQQQGARAYGQFAFQGAFIYKVDLAEGFKLRGTITHLSENDLKKAGSSGHDPVRAVDRILYIGDTLYTLSQGEIRANGLDRLEEKKRLLLSSE